jgi:hypothetical protein
MNVSGHSRACLPTRNKSVVLGNNKYNNKDHHLSKVTSGNTGTPCIAESGTTSTAVKVKRFICPGHTDTDRSRGTAPLTFNLSTR